MIMMRNQKRQVSEENLAVVRSKKRCSFSGGEKKYFDPIPVDIVINILSKLSGKLMAKFRCVSKLWSSIICRPYYKELFPVKSPDPPRFLFTFVGGGKLFFCTSPQPQNPDEDSSFVATRHHSKPFTDFTQIFGPVHGLVCHQRTRENYIFVLVSNPITGESVTLPKLITNKAVEAKSYLGYDPVEKRFKVLCISWMRRGTEKELCHEHQVLTLEDERRNLLWRKIDCCIPFDYAQTDQSDDGICINGVLYYTTTTVDDKRMIVCFDVRSERFDLISWRPSTLINYKGKLGAVDHCGAKNFVLWVLEDSKEDEWSKHVYEKPQGLDAKQVYVAGVTCGGEVVLCPKYAVQIPLYILFYNFKTNIVVRVRVEVPGFGSFKWPRVYTSPNYVEHVKLM